MKRIFGFEFRVSSFGFRVLRVPRPVSRETLPPYLQTLQLFLAVCATLVSLSFASGQPSTAQKMEHFDRDPGWDGYNNRSTAFDLRNIRQDFGYSRTSYAGGSPGEIGGFISPAAEPAYYAKKIPTMTLKDTLTASGKLYLSKGGTLDDGAGNTLIGFFNSKTLNEWRTPKGSIGKETVRLLESGNHPAFILTVSLIIGRWSIPQPLTAAGRSPLRWTAKPSVATSSQGTGQSTRTLTASAS